MGKRLRKPANLDRYAWDVLRGRVVVGELVRRACQRSLDDHQGAKTRGLRFDRAAADHAERFFGFLSHSKGEWSGQRFELAPWQRFILRELFGWKRRDGTRRFRSAYTEVARKAGKTTFAAGIGLYMLYGCGEPGSEVYTAATKHEQARLMHSEAIAMVRGSAALSAELEIWKNNISHPGSRSKYEPLSSDARKLDGLNVFAALIDELHEHPNGDLYEVLETSTGARREPLLFSITTAGSDEGSYCWSIREYADKVVSGVVVDDSTFAYIASLDDGDDWTDESVWLKAQPNLGVTVQLAYMREQVGAALEAPRKQNGVRRKLLNQWTRADTRFIDLIRWDENAGELMPAQIETAADGRRAFGGLDLASTTDVAAFVLVFPGDDPSDPVSVVPRFWIPADGIAERSRKNRTPYDLWEREGWLRGTPGEVIDHREIRDEILRLSERYEIAEIAFDRWGASHLTGELEDAGIPMVQMGQGYASMSWPTKQLEALVLSRALHHGGHPVLRSHADALCVDTDPAGNIKPRKPGHKKSASKIDGMVALIMALDRALRHGAARVEETSVYEGRGVLTL